MAFSFRAGTNWCHDFPKLARDSGFYFNMHRTRVRVDWNRICSLNIDHVIQESDFQTVDDNVNNVIDYSLEHEYDVKILDPNFVKLFRLAQLAVEYLLFCKQYLDQSVIILKDELKIKIEENVKIRKEMASLSEVVKELKERNKSIDLRLSPQGEVHKCPYCPKSFISAMYCNAHVSRRHSTSSPVPDDYKNETEKLHNEIKNLKERLNQTEKLLNVSNKWEEPVSVQKVAEKVVEKVDKAANTEETSCFIEKHAKPVKSLEDVNKRPEDTNAALISELKLRMESDMESVQSKLSSQEHFWKSKMETLESQHRQDIENLFTQLKLTQQAASLMKSEYEFKIKDLEHQSLSQSEMINAQTEMLHNLSRGIQDCKISQTRRESLSKETGVNLVRESSQKPNGFVTPMEVTPMTPRKPLPKQQSSQEISNSVGYLESSSESSPETVKRKPEQKVSSRFSDVKERVKTKPKKEVEVEHVKRDRNSALIDEFVNQTAKRLSSEKKGRKEQEESESKESCSEEQTESYSESEETETSSETKTESEVSETLTESVTDEPEDRRTRGGAEEKRKEHPAASEDLKEDMREIFNRKMQNLGIDPDWEGIPKATFKQKSNILRHHQNINAKKYPKYANIRERLLQELSKKLSTRPNEPKKPEPPKQGLLSKVKMRAMKAFNIQKNDTPKSPVIQKQVTHPRGIDARQLFGTSRARKMSLDDAELRKSMEKEGPTRVSDSRLNNRSGETQSQGTPTKVQKHHSYDTIEDFIRGSRKLEMTGTKVTSTPTKNVRNVMQQSYEDETDNVSMSSDMPLSPPMSPKGSKSVLKTHPSSAGGSSVKKRVEFDLDNRRSFSGPPNRAVSFGDVTEYNRENRNSIDSDLNVSSISDDKPQSRKPEKVTVASRKMTNVSDTSELSSPVNVRSPLHVREKRMPQAAPRNLQKSSVRSSVPEIPVSNLEADIEEILQIT